MTSTPTVHRMSRDRDSGRQSMNKKILWAGAAGALLLGSVAIAQDQPYSGTPAPSADAQASDTTAQSADTAATDTAGSEMDRAGERG